MRFFNFLAVSAVAVLSTVSASEWNRHNATEAEAQCNSCCSSSGSAADDSACKITSQVNGVPVTSQIQCCGIIGNSAFCCPTLADGETSCKYINIPFFQKYTCGSSSSPATVAPTTDSSASTTTKPWSDNSDNTWSPSQAPSTTDSPATTDSASTATPSASSTDSAWPAGQNLDAAGVTVNGNNNDNSSSASATLAWWVWLLIAIGIVLILICVVLSVLRWCVEATCSCWTPVGYNAKPALAAVPVATMPVYAPTVYAPTRPAIIVA